MSIPDELKKCGEYINTKAETKKICSQKKISAVVGSREAGTTAAKQKVL